MGRGKRGGARVIYFYGGEDNAPVAPARSAGGQTDTGTDGSSDGYEPVRLPQVGTGSPASQQSTMESIHGRKHFLALDAGFRESVKSWKAVLLSLRNPGTAVPKLGTKSFLGRAHDK